MFWPDGAIFRYIGVYTISFFLLLLSPHWPVFTHIGSGWYVWSFCPFFVKCIIFGMYKILNYYIKTMVKLSKMLNTKCVYVRSGVKIRSSLAVKVLKVIIKTLPSCYYSNPFLTMGLIFLKNTAAGKTKA
jgi:hypothetical protein